MNYLINFILLTVTSILISSCSSVDKYSSLKPDEKIIFGRILYREKIFEKNDFTDRKPNVFQRIADDYSGKKAFGLIMICFDIINEYRDECSFLNTKDLDPGYYLGANKNPYYEGDNIFSFKIKSNEIRLNKVSVAGNYFEFDNVKKIKIEENSKIIYIGDILIALKDPQNVKLSLNTLKNIEDAAHVFAKKISIPNGTNIYTSLLDLEGAKYKISKVIKDF